MLAAEAIALQEGNPGGRVTTGEVFSGKKVVLFGVPGIITSDITFREHLLTTSLVKVHLLLAAIRHTSQDSLRMSTIFARKV